MGHQRRGTGARLAQSAARARQHRGGFSRRRAAGDLVLGSATGYPERRGRHRDGVVRASRGSERAGRLSSAAARTGTCGGGSGGSGSHGGSGSGGPSYGGSGSGGAGSGGPSSGGRAAPVAPAAGGSGCGGAACGGAGGTRAAIAIVRSCRHHRARRRSGDDQRQGMGCHPAHHRQPSPGPEASSREQGGLRNRGARRGSGHQPGQGDACASSSRRCPGRSRPSERSGAEKPLEVAAEDPGAAVLFGAESPPGWRAARRESPCATPCGK